MALFWPPRHRRCPSFYYFYFIFHFTLYVPVRPDADDPSLNFLFPFGMDYRPCARRHLVCEYPAESYRGRRASGPKTAASVKVKSQQQR
ncbi:hypothetical protein BJV77DRAFT_1005907 [Russula vinacea]|jgi:hypothetical protein|nr:hypothetical protein BJV77DRAFT_1005907 [Russula vinacea]